MRSSYIIPFQESLVAELELHRAGFVVAMAASCNAVQLLFIIGQYRPLRRLECLCSIRTTIPYLQFAILLICLAVLVGSSDSNESEIVLEVPSHSNRIAEKVD